MKRKQKRPICTHCGSPAIPVTWDDVFPKALWADISQDRAIKVASCNVCNNQSNEAVLKHFFVVLDSRFHQETLEHFQNREARGDVRTFLKMQAGAGKKYYLYLDEVMTARFVKMFMGLRRHLMGRAWKYVPAEQFVLFQLEEHANGYKARRLPLAVGGPNRSEPIAPAFAEALSGPMAHRFRDFSYEWLGDDAEGMTIGLRYERDEFAGVGNRLHLLCFVHTHYCDCAGRPLAATLTACPPGSLLTLLSQLPRP